jgi:ATP-binding protein involved in chromosome partitioning
LTLCQRVPLTGAVVVSTPQDVALLDVIRGVNMFRKVNVPVCIHIPSSPHSPRSPHTLQILGVIENMSHYKCSNCGHKEYLFGQEGAKQTSDKLNVSFLGDVPIDVEIRKTSGMIILHLISFFC